MMHLPHKQLLPALALIVLATACGAPKKTAFQRLPAMPERFGNDSSTVSAESPTVSRKDLFPDQRLQALIDTVLKANPDLRSADQHVTMAYRQLRMDRQQWLPSLGAEARASGTRYGKYTIDGVGNFDTNLSPNISDNQRVDVSATPDLFGGLRSSWEIDLWGRLRNRRRASQQRFFASEQGRQLLTTELVARTATLYYDLVALDREVEILNENIEMQEQALRIVEHQKEGGRATELAVQQFRAQLLNTRNVAVEVRQRTVATENALNALMGRMGGTLERTPPPLPGRSNLLQVAAPTTVLRKRPDVMRAEAEFAASQADVAAARAAFFPTLDLTGYLAYTSFNPDLWVTPASLGFQFLGGLTAPIFQRGKIRGEYAIANAQQEAAFHSYRGTVLDAYSEVLTLMQGIVNAEEQAKLKQEEVDALRAAVRVSRDLYVNGYASYLEIVMAQSSKLHAQREQLDVQRNLTRSVIELYRALGGGTQ